MLSNLTNVLEDVVQPSGTSEDQLLSSSPHDQSTPLLEYEEANQ